MLLGRLVLVLIVKVCGIAARPRRRFRKAKKRGQLKARFRSVKARSACSTPVLVMIPYERAHTRGEMLNVYEIVCLSTCTKRLEKVENLDTESVM